MLKKVAKILFLWGLSLVFASNHDEADSIVYDNVNLLLNQPVLWPTIPDYVKHHCGVLIANNGEILRELIRNKKTNMFEQLVALSCNCSHEIFRMAARVASEENNERALFLLYGNLAYLSTSDSVANGKSLFEECITAKNYTCLQFFEENLCRMTSRKGRNVLHYAAMLNDLEMFNQVKRCNLLIIYKDKKGKYPMEYVVSKDLAVKFNERWLEVAKEKYLPIETAQKRLEMLEKFDLESESEVSITEDGKIERGLMIKEAYETALIEDAEEIYCPYLKMKINLLTAKYEEISEWINLLLADIFVNSDSNDTANFKAPFLDYSDGKFCPTGKYDEKVYQFLGKIFAIAQHFIKLNHEFGKGNDPSKFKIYEAFTSGFDSMKFLRLEKHERLILKGRDFVVPINIDDSGLSKEYEAKFLRAFDQLSDKRKLNLLNLASKDQIGDKPITFKLKKSENDVASISVNQNKREIAVYFGNLTEISKEFFKIV